MNQPVLGTLVPAGSYRDAVHVAISPTVAADAMMPGDHVRIRAEDGAGCFARHDDPRAVGIVDPFLTKAVVPGEVFWLCVYPNSVTSLRHAWTHPVIRSVATRPAAYPAVVSPFVPSFPAEVVE